MSYLYLVSVFGDIFVMVLMFLELLLRFVLALIIFVVAIFIVVSSHAFIYFLWLLLYISVS